MMRKQSLAIGLIFCVVQASLQRKLTALEGELSAKQTEVFCEWERIASHSLHELS